VDRTPGLSVRLKLTLSYAGFLMLAGGVLLAALGVFLARYAPDSAIFDTGGVLPDGSVVLRGTPIEVLKLAARMTFAMSSALAPAVAVALAFLLMFGLVGGWLLAGRMLAPLTRITNATRMAANGSLSHRIHLEGRKNEFRELADAFDAMLARLEAHVVEQRRFAANAPTSCAPRWRSHRASSRSPVTIRTATAASLTNAFAPSTRERST
jgi:two-component system, OmpR family, sensor histidine kinase VanS